MPILDQLEKHNAGHFGFSAAKIDDLGATEYTLATIVADRSGSTAGFQVAMENALKEIVKSCQLSPRSDNLLLRLVGFDSKVDEIHGFRQLNQCNLTDYDGVLNPRGMTALNDACLNGIEATKNYGEQLINNDFEANAILFFITDGLENNSTHSSTDVKKSIQDVVTSEKIESVRTVLIAVNHSGSDNSLDRELDQFKNTVGIDQFVCVNNASAKELAKLAKFISESISSQSQALGSGQPSQSLVF